LHWWDKRERRGGWGYGRLCLRTAGRGWAGVLEGSAAKTPENGVGGPFW